MLFAYFNGSLLKKIIVVQYSSYRINCAIIFFSLIYSSTRKIKILKIITYVSSVFKMLIASSKKRKKEGIDGAQGVDTTIDSSTEEMDDCSCNPDQLLNLSEARTI